MAPEFLNCPRCRIPLRQVEGSGGLLYRCSGGHGYMALSLLDEQSQLVAKLLDRVEDALERRMSLAGELASRAEARHHLRYLERVIDESRDTLEFVQGSLRRS